MSLTVTGVPATIERSKVVALIEALGIDPHSIRHLEIGLHSIRAEVFARNEDGKRYLDGFERNNVATHEVSIEVVDR
jgi:hypothetical protein